jgi:hypothetical protein
LSSDGYAAIAGSVSNVVSVSVAMMRLVLQLSAAGSRAAEERSSGAAGTRAGPGRTRDPRARDFHHTRVH